MFPTIRSGDMLTIDTADENYNINDIVVYYSNESDGIKLVAHRITHIFDNRFVITKGDNNAIADKPIRINRIIGRVVEIRERQTKDEEIEN